MLQGEGDDIRADLVRDTVPDRPGPGSAIGKRIEAAIAPTPVPVEIGLLEMPGIFRVCRVGRCDAATVRMISSFRATVSIHSFTPRMNGIDQPWDIGLMMPPLPRFRGGRSGTGHGANEGA